MPSGYPPENPFQTQTDRELAAAGNLMDAFHQLQAHGASAVPAGTIDETDPGSSGKAIPLRLLCERHAEYMGEFWSDCEALYKGGPHLLRNPQVMRRLFPPHNAEVEPVYKERCRRAFYMNYAGSIINTLVSGLESDPLRLAAKGAKADDPPEATKVDAWWDEWAGEVTAPGADLEHRKSLHQIVCAAVLSASVKQSCWILADLPKVNEEVAATVDSLAVQDALKLRDPYLCLLDAEAVTDWDTDDDGSLTWAIVWGVERRRLSPAQGRGVYRHTWTIWTAEGWERYQLDVDPAKVPGPNTMVHKVAEGSHPFGEVPLVRFKLPDGLWAMGTLESLAREHLNKRSAASWAEFKSLFAVLYEFLGPEQMGAKIPVPANQQDPKRALVQTRGVAHTQRRGAGDDARYVGPDVAPFKEARESCLETMREMHRLTKTLASSANTDSAALQRSGESKADDRKDTQVVLEAFGLRGRALGQALVDLVAAGRDEEADLDAVGLEAFSAGAVMDKINEAVALFAGVPILSATFKRMYLESLYRSAAGDDADEETLNAIHEELQQTCTQEQVEAGMMPGSGLPGTPAAPEPDPDADPDEEEDDDDPPAPRTVKKPAAGRRTLVAS